MRPAQKLNVIRAATGGVLLALLMLAGCASVTEPASTEQQLRALVLDQYVPAFRQGDVDRWIGLFAENAVGMHNTLPPMQGRAAIREFAETVREQLRIERMDITVDEVRVSDDWAFTRGSFRTLYLPKHAPTPPDAMPQEGKFVLLWERQPDGNWKIILDMGNNNTR